MKNLFPILLFIALMILIDFYVFKSLRLVISGWDNTLVKRITAWAYWITSIGAYAFLVYAFLNFRSSTQQMEYFFIFTGFGIFLLLFVPKIIVAGFHAVEDVVHLFRYIASLVGKNTDPTSPPTIGSLTRWQFISRMGWVLAALPFAGILYGMLRGRYAFRVERKQLAFANLPASAHKLKIVHISDIHIGSFFNNHDAVQRGVNKINELKPDLIFFTGDLVNNFADELMDWESTLSQLKAKYGIYSILGNHDYGDYVTWPSLSAKSENLEKLKAYHKKLGFRLLLNEKVDFSTAEGETFEIIGLENWGLGGFSQYGDLKKALSSADPNKFQILLSHDPSHWDAEVLGKTKIDLALAGHTHGMQFGVEIPGLIKWSPVKYRYPRWGGLYEVGEQRLYVNRGFGYIGFPGRVGMAPEITLLELQKA